MVMKKILIIAFLFVLALADPTKEEVRSDAQEVKGKVQMHVSAQSTRRLQIAPGLPPTPGLPTTPGLAPGEKNTGTGFSTDPNAQQSMKEAIANMAGAKVEDVKLHSTDSSLTSERRLSFKSNFVDTSYSVACQNPAKAKDVATKLSKQSPADVTNAVQSRLQENGASAGRRLAAQYNVACTEHNVAQKVAGTVQMHVSKSSRRLQMASTTGASFANDDRSYKSVKEAIATAGKADVSSVSTSWKEEKPSGRRLAATNSSVDVDYWIDTWTDGEAQNIQKDLKGTSPAQMTELVQQRLLANGATDYDVQATEHTVQNDMHGPSGFNWSLVIIPVLAVAMGASFCFFAGRKRYKRVLLECEDESSCSEPA